MECEPNTPHNFYLDLEQGWNLISIPCYVEPEDRAPGDLLAGILDTLDTCYAYDACAVPADAWKSFSTNGPPGDLTAMRDGYGYWMLMDASDTLHVAGYQLPEPPTPPPAYNLCTGWNLIGVRSHVEVKASEYLSSIAGKYAVVYRYSGGSYFNVNADYMMQPGDGFWIAMIQPGLLQY